MFQLQYKNKFQQVFCYLVMLMMVLSHSVEAKTAQENTDQSLLFLANEIVTAINQRDSDSLNAVFDYPELARRAAISSTDNERERKAFIRGMLKDPGKFGRRFIKSVDFTSGKAKFLRVIKQGDQERILIRLNLGESGFDYKEFVVRRQLNHHYKVIDLYQLTAGQLLSDTIGSIAKLMMDPDPAIVKKLFGINQFDDDLLKQLVLMNKYAQQNKYEEAYQVFNDMPSAVRNARIMLTLGLSYVNYTGDDAKYKQLLGDLARYHSLDPAAAFMLIDHYVYQGDTHKALSSVNLIESKYGQDAALETIRANLYLISNDLKKSLISAKKGIALEPDFEEAYFSLAEGYIRLGRYQEAIDTFEMLVSLFGYQFSVESFNSEPTYFKFIDSKAFKNWSHIQQNNLSSAE